MEKLFNYFDYLLKSKLQLKAVSLMPVRLILSPDSGLLTSGFLWSASV